jgi:DNA-directed RNA polymerase subunit RPC12/RpoP
MPMLALICPKCGGSIELDDSREYGFCSYCGTRIVLERGNGDVEGIRRLLLLNRDDRAKVRQHAEEIVRACPKDPIAWYYLSLSKTETCDDNALRFGVESCGGAKEFQDTVTGYLDSNGAGPFDSRVACKLHDLYPDEIITAGEEVIRKYSKWAPDHYDDEIVKEYDEAVRDIESAMQNPWSDDEESTLRRLKFELETRMKSLESKFGPWRCRRIVCKTSGTRPGEAAFTLQYGPFFATMAENPAGTFSTTLFPSAERRLEIRWRLDDETVPVYNSKTIGRILTTRKASMKPIWHTGNCPSSPDWKDEVTLEFEKKQGHLELVGSNIENFHIST